MLRRVRSHLAGGVVGVLGQLEVHAVQADRVGDVAHGEAGLIQDGDDAFVRLLHQVDDDLVVEVVDLDTNAVRCQVRGKCVTQFALVALINAPLLFIHQHK